MKARHVFSIFIFSLCLAGITYGQRTLSSSEVQEIFRTLTSRPRTTWIPAGTIEASHHQYGAPKITDPAVIEKEVSRQIQEYASDPDKIEQTEELQKMKLDAIPFNVRYDLTNEYTMDSQVVVKYDGNKFFWKIDVSSRQDSLTPDASLTGNCMTDQFDADFNGQRIFVWDGDKYTIYAASGKCASVDAAGMLSHGVTGPLTAGVIPWGYGRFGSTSLAGATVSASESPDAKNRIQMTVTWPNATSASLTLDSSMNYAVTACTIVESNNTVVSITCDAYRLVANNWVPSTVLIERRDTSTSRLLASDEWTLSLVDGRIPSPTSFAVAYSLDTTVEYTSPLTSKPATYIYSNSVDTERLLTDRLAYVARQSRQRQNCATAAVSYVVSSLGKTVSTDALASLVQPDGQTNMYSMKQLLQGLGLYCRAVKTDLAGLRALDGVQAILYIPGKKHFIVLGSIDERHVRVIDLSNDKFYYRHSVDFFPLEWTDGIALLVSRRSIGGRFTNLNDTTLTMITGTSGYLCTNEIQKSHIYYCPDQCDGYLYMYAQRFSCAPAETGTCTNDPFIRYVKSPCELWPDHCDITYEWTIYWMFACE